LDHFNEIIGAEKKAAMTNKKNKALGLAKRVLLPSPEIPVNIS